MRWLAAIVALLVPTALPGAAGAVECRTVEFEDIPFTTCEVGPDDDLRLFLRGEGGTYGSFSAVNRALAAQGEVLSFAMNAGMYHRDLSPVGLFIADGVKEGQLVTREGPGNFGMLPNGVFCWSRGDYHVVDSRKFAPLEPKCRYATQSGPMLVIDGKLHPRFLPDSDSLYIRNGVGVSKDNRRAVFVLSERAVNFHRFARFFRDGLGLANALYFDGNISRLYSSQLGRNDMGFPMGPIVGTVARKG